jgi:hypothetical protein
MIDLKTSAKNEDKTALKTRAKTCQESIGIPPTLTSTLQFPTFEEFLKIPCFKISNNNSREGEVLKILSLVPQKGGSAGHLSSGAKGHFSTAGIRLSWIGDDFETDFLVFFGGFLDSILSTIWPGFACPLRYVRRGLKPSSRKVPKVLFSKVIEAATTLHM